jgi:ketosteroid isomerase-like protein
MPPLTAQAYVADTHLTLGGRSLDTVSEEFARDFAHRFLTGWNSRDPRQLLALSTEDVLWEDPYIEPDGRAQGHDAVHAWLRSVWRAFPDLHVSLLDAEDGTPMSGLYLSADRTHVAVPWLGAGTMRGPLDTPGVSPAGRRIEQMGVDLWAFRDGRLCHVRSFTGVLAVARQIGDAPPPGSRGGRFAALLHHVAIRRFRRQASHGPTHAAPGMHGMGTAALRLPTDRNALRQ